MHSLHAYIFKSDTIDLSGIPHAEHCGFAIVPMSEQLFKALGDPKLLEKALVEKLGTFADIQTDYFGGFGDQTAKLFLNGVEEYVASPDAPIDEALAKLGVAREGDMDEFDTIKLGNYRVASDIIEEWEAVHKQVKDKSGLEIERRFLLKSVPGIITDRIIGGLRGKKILQVYTVIDGENVRLRKVFDPDSNGYTFVETKKKTVAYGTNQEDEREITEDEYTSGLKNATKHITKTRYEYEGEDGLTWEIDDFGSMVIAEVELPSIDHPVIMPDCVSDRLVMEITGMPAFSNFNLATKI